MAGTVWAACLHALYRALPSHHELVCLVREPSDSRWGDVAWSFHPEIQQNAYTSSTTSLSNAHTNNSEGVSHGFHHTLMYLWEVGLGHKHSQVLSPKRDCVAPQYLDLVGIFVPPTGRVRTKYRDSKMRFVFAESAVISQTRSGLLSFWLSANPHGPFPALTQIGMAPGAGLPKHRLAARGWPESGSGREWLEGQ